MIGPGMSGSKPRVLHSLEANSKSSKKCQTLHADSVIECDLGRWRGKREGYRRERAALGLPTLPLTPPTVLAWGCQNSELTFDHICSDQSIQPRHW